jgi:hypothetical protein
MLSRLAVLPALTLSLALVGCGNPCVETCTAQRDCEGADPEVDCEALCADQQKSAEDSGCTSEYDKVIDCVSGTDDVCAVTNETCKDESDAQLVCLVEYCTNFPSETVCAN